MDEVITIQVNPVTLEQVVYIFTNKIEKVPVTINTTINELPSVVAMSAAKYGIQYIKIAGAKSYAAKIRDTITEKINTCFGKDNGFVIELM